MTTTSTAATKAMNLLCCPCCGEREAQISLQLWDGDLACTSCDATFSRADLRDIIAGWQKLLSWMDQMPKA